MRALVVLAVCSFGVLTAGCSSPSKSATPTTTASTASTTTTATTIEVTTTTIAIDRSTVDAVFDQFIGMVHGLNSKGVDKTDVNAVIESIRGARTGAETGAKLTASPIAGVPATVLAPLNVAFTDAATRIDAWITCAENNPVLSTELCATQLSEATTASGQLGTSAVALTSYGTRSGPEILALLK